MFIKSGDHTSVEEIVLANTGLTKEEYFSEDRHPYLHGLDEAVRSLKEYTAAHPDHPVTIIGDYDADGICGAAILYHAVRAYLYGKCEAPVFTRIPKRFSEGYGLSEKMIDEIDKGLILTVDNGITAIDAVAAAKKKGFHVIITDHHLPMKSEDGRLHLPDADCIIDPNAETQSVFSGYCGAGIAYRFAETLLEREIPQLLVLAAIATVADVMPMIKANRLLVKDGLSYLNREICPPGISALKKALNLGAHSDEEDIAFRIGPALNAPGRLSDDGSSYALTLLKAGVQKEAIDRLASWICSMNEQRKDILRVQFARYTDDGSRPIIAFLPGCGEGIIGLIAGRLCSDHYCPAIVFTDTRDGALKGSGRSIPELNLKEILDSVSVPDFTYGGHAGAAGIRLSSADDLKTFTQEFMKACGPVPDKKTDLIYDLEISVSEAAQVMEALKRCGPFGEKNPRPRFRIRFTPRYGYQAIGDGSHIRFYDPALTVLGFGMMEDYRNAGCPDTIDGIGILSENWYRGSCSLQLQLQALCQD